MKGFAALVLLALLGLCTYNWYEIRSLRAEVARLEHKIQEQQAGGITDQAVAQAVRAMAQAREALGRTDMNGARAFFNDAQKRLAEAGRTVGEKASPTVKWLEGQASDLGRQVQDRIHR